MKKTIIVTAACVENDNHEILCALRSHHMSLPNKWEVMLQECGSITRILGFAGCVIIFLIRSFGYSLKILDSYVPTGLTIKRQAPTFSLRMCCLSM